MSERWFTVKEIAELLHVHEMTIRNWIRSGLLGSSKFGNIVRVSDEDLEKFRRKAE